MFFRKKKPQVKDYDRETLEPVILSSICTGEQTAGFRRRDTGKFTGDRLLRTQEDLEAFRREYGIEGDIPTVY